MRRSVYSTPRCITLPVEYLLRNQGESPSGSAPFGIMQSCAVAEQEICCSILSRIIKIKSSVDRSELEMTSLNEKPDILRRKLKLLQDNRVPDSFVTSSGETFEWIWLPSSDPNQILSIRNSPHLLLNMRNVLPITMESHLNFLESYNSLQRIDFVLINKERDQYVGGMNIVLTFHGFEMGKYIGNSDYLGRGVAYQMSLNFLRFLKENVSEIKTICAVTKTDNIKNLNLNFKLGFKIMRRVDDDYWLMELK